MAVTSGVEVGSGTWETYCLWDDDNIYMIVYEIIILIYLFSDDLLTCTLKICAIFTYPVFTYLQKFK